MASVACWAAARCRTGVMTHIGVRRTFSCCAAQDAGDAVDMKMQRVTESLAAALEGTEYISESAEQLYLETDPAARQPKERYRVAHQIMARDQLVDALGRLEALQACLSSEEKSKLLSEPDVRIMVADCMLARDNLTSALIGAEEKAAAWKRGDFSSIEC